MIATAVISNLVDVVKSMEPVKLSEEVAASSELSVKVKLPENGTVENPATMAKVCQKDKNVKKQESSPVNSPIGMRAEEKLEVRIVVQTRKEELEEYLQGVELHLETARKSL